MLPQYTDISQYLDAKIALRRARGSDAGKQDLLPFLILPSLNFNGEKHVYQ